MLLTHMSIPSSNIIIGGFAGTMWYTGVYGPLYTCNNITIEWVNFHLDRFITIVNYLMLLAVEDAARKINMSFNTKKTVCMVFHPYRPNRRKIISAVFPQFTLAGCKLQFLEHFRHLGHIIDICISDDKDIQREIKALFTRSTYCVDALRSVRYKWNWSYFVCFAFACRLWCGALMWCSG